MQSARERDISGAEREQENEQRRHKRATEGTPVAWLRGCWLVGWDRDARGVPGAAPQEIIVGIVWRRRQDGLAGRACRRRDSARRRGGWVVWRRGPWRAGHARRGPA